MSLKSSSQLGLERRCENFLLYIETAFKLSRYVMVVQWKMTKAFGVSNLVNVFIAISILAPAIVTLSLQYPVGQFIHGPFHFCNGRFEVYFAPAHPGNFKFQGPFDLKQIILYMAKEPASFLEVVPNMVSCSLVCISQLGNYLKMLKILCT